MNHLPATLAALPLLLLLLPAAGPPARVDGFAAGAAARCPTAPAAACLAAAFAFLDADGDGRVVAGELRAAETGGREWLARNGKRLPPADRALLASLLLAAQATAPETVIEAYDTDGDGALTPAELFADIRTDGRPLGRLLRDPEAVDWEAMGRRFGWVAGILRAAVLALPPDPAGR